MIAIIDYGRGNLFSVEKAFVKLGADVIVTNDIEKIRRADKVVLPGVGAFGDCMETLKKAGLIPVIQEAATSGKPFLGICLGLQLLFERSEESPGVAGLGIFKGAIRQIVAPKLKVPHMGWNSLSLKNATSLLKGLPENPYVYFVHSFHAVPEDASIITAVTEYGSSLTAAVGKGNVQAMQFHPEKSSSVGLKILESFVKNKAV
ncbi:imidazole glycerol phosphate synthase subunit HisH [Anaerosinus gibii]|uniref:Imidazole glycerol phosphate synthase subunit HisH n=1 Tax=Selenobaculum gibii TaxID=3054208 RepID=A0A9Y2EVR1_9FIRM|nr:imidazole glycerol phosphate synthase subunit HisH [Selenobaculum gbiensis]WIW71554.1 imidazole glycerol phosphate synthase subunit HisH [Selenobaculum gbiensis]